MRIHARALTGFDMIRRCGSIREASRRLNISSSALNRQLLQLEAELGMPLFERLPQGLRLTPVGEILARHVMALLQDLQRLEGELAALKGLRTGTLDIASVAALTPSFLPNVLQRMTALYPAVSVNVRIADSVECGRLVASGDADLALAFLRQKNPAIRQYAVGSFPLGAVVPATHPLATGRRSASRNARAIRWSCRIANCRSMRMSPRSPIARSESPCCSKPVRWT